MAVLEQCPILNMVYVSDLTDSGIEPATFEPITMYSTIKLISNLVLNVECPAFYSTSHLVCFLFVCDYFFCEAWKSRKNPFKPMLKVDYVF